MAVDVTAAVLGIVIGLGVAIGVLLVVLAVYCKARRDVELVVNSRRLQARRRTKFTSSELRDADNRQVVYAQNDEIRIDNDDNRPPQMYGIAYRPRMYFPDVPPEVARPQLVDGFPDGPVDYGFVSRPAPEIVYQPQQNTPRQQQFVEVYRDNAAYRDDVETQPTQPTQPPQQVEHAAERRWTDDRRGREMEEQSEDSDDESDSDVQDTRRRPVARPMNIDRRHHMMTPFAFNLFQTPQTAIVAVPAMLPAAPPVLQAAPAPAPPAAVQPPPAPVQPTPAVTTVPSVQQPATSGQSAEIRREPEYTWTTSAGSDSAAVSNFAGGFSGTGYAAATGARDSGGYAMFGRTDGGFSWQQQLQQPREFEEQERCAVKGGSGRRINSSTSNPAAGASSEVYVARAVVAGDTDVQQRAAAAVAGVHGQQRTNEEQERSAIVDSSNSNNGAGAGFFASAYSPGFP